MKNKYKNSLYTLFGFYSISYVIFTIIFFTFLGHVSVDTVIGVSVLILFFFIYKYSSEFIYIYLWNSTKTILFHFITLFSLLNSLRNILININNSYLTFIKAKFIILNVVSKEINKFWNDISIQLLKKLYINQVNMNFFMKLNIIENITKKNNFFLLANDVLSQNKMIIWSNIIFLLSYKN